MGTAVKLVGRFAGQQVIALVGNDELAEIPETGSLIELAFDEQSLMHF
jgi:DNA-binding sugar fermentation-stimulating protein